MFLPKVGEGEPLVTTPMCSPATFEQQYSSRAIPRSIISRPTSVRFNPAALERSSAARPIKSPLDRKSTRLNSSHTVISYAVFCLKKKKKKKIPETQLKI